LILGLVAALTLLGPSCTGQGETTRPSPPNSPSPSLKAVTDYSSFMDGLETAGFSVRPGGRAGFPSELLGVLGNEILIDGLPVLAFEFPNEKSLVEMRSTIRPRGDTIGTAIINWSDPPRFYGAGRLLVLYFGDKQRTLDALDGFLGQQFAGG
jgi:hypothetical protein